MEHPCFDNEAHYRVGRIHLPVALKCNIKCRYCEAGVCVDGMPSIPGATLKVISPSEAVSVVRRAIKAEPRNKIAAVAGPGDPLANHQTFETLALIKKHFPQLKTCMSTNGLVLLDKVRPLHEMNLDFLTVTVNAASVDSARKIYRWITVDGRRSRDFKVLLENQQSGVELAHELGIIVKINTVLIPGINEHEVEKIARWASKYAYIMNVMPLIPLGEFRGKERPSCAQMDTARLVVKKHMRLLTCCKQCRADAVGIPGLEKSTQPKLWRCLHDFFCRH
jgi:nitrogen fixation protein NifB